MEATPSLLDFGSPRKPASQPARGAIENGFDETLIAELAAAEKQVQQSYRPVIAVHKWFARRPGTLFRGLALAELDSRALADHYFDAHDFEGVLLDPFMGGGTSLFEGTRLGLSVVGYDTNPMSRWLVERELEPLDVEEFERAGEEVASAVEKELAGLYTTECAECGQEAQVKYFMWVKTHECECGRKAHLFPGSLVAGRKMGRHTHDVLVCGSCLEVRQFLQGAIPASCPSCAAPYADAKIPAKSKCACGSEFHVGRPTADGPPQHTLFALEYHCAPCKSRDGRKGRFFKGADKADHARFAKASDRCRKLDSPGWPDDRIPQGDETNRLLRWGYERFSDLHNERQLLGLSILAEKIRQQPEHLRPALATVFSDFLRYQNMVCRYDTAALKVLDVFSVHGFPVHRVQCEAALIGIPRVGSGGYRHFLAKYAAAKRYCAAPYETRSKNGRKRRIQIDGESIAANVIETPDDLAEERAALLRCASISTEPLAENSVDLVLTDPPYFANVQYSELMDFCYAWLRKLMPGTPFFSESRTGSSDEITGNVVGERGIDHFADGLSGVFQAATAALKPGRAFVFTYHHNDLASYAALVVAVLDSGLVPMTTLVCPSEMRGSIHINKSDSSRVDSVFVLRKPPVAAAGDRNIPLNQRLDAHVTNLTDADLIVTTGDRRCIRHGLLAEEAIRALAADWSAEEPIAQRLRIARDMLSHLDALHPLPATEKPSDQRSSSQPV